MTMATPRQMLFGAPDKVNSGTRLLGESTTEIAFALDSREPSVMRNKALDRVGGLRRTVTRGPEEAGSIQDLFLELFE
jgi:hypothetical protein